MSRRDPTLPSAPADTLPESDLISRVKTDADSTALLALISRHTGIYFDVVNRYAASYPNAIKARDLDDDKLFNLYQFILAYDPNRGMKLSTYICDRTDYLCKTILKRDARNPISPGTYAQTGAMALDRNEDTYSTSDGRQVTLIDESPHAQVPDQAHDDLSIETIRQAAGDACQDPRFTRILTYRHFNTKHCTMSWRDIAKRMNLSHERVRQVYDEGIIRVKEYLKETVT